MPLVNHSPRELDSIRKADGSVLHGERDMYKRIVEDCEKSPLVWHMFYDLSLTFRHSNTKKTIQIDFLLLCVKGAIVVEVKGGVVSVYRGQYSFLYQGTEVPISPSPFRQAEGNMWDLFNNHILSKKEIFMDFACAFPHSVMDYTNPDQVIDERWKLWTNAEHSDENKSFADFCVSVLEEKVKREPIPRPDLTEVQLDAIVSRLAPTVFSRKNYSESSIKEILDWLEVSDMQTLEGLSPNSRIFIEGGPGTGKTTIAKAYVKKYSQQKGLYLCWNKLLHSRIKSIMSDAMLNNCDVMQYGSFLMNLPKSPIRYEDIEGDRQLLTTKIRSYLKEHENDGILPSYDYIIVDESHDILDKGIIEVLDRLSCICGDGTRNGRYLVFFDNEQGYDSETRNLTEYASRLSEYCAKFVLLNNRRVLTNRLIVDVAEKVRDARTYADLEPTFKSIEGNNDFPIQIKHFANSTDLIQYIKLFSKERHDAKDANKYTLLSHSSMKYIIGRGRMSVYEVVSEMANIKELTVDNVNIDSPESVQLSTILSYKGMENHHIVLMLKKGDSIRSFELYIGITRAIVSVDLLILD